MKTMRICIGVGTVMAGCLLALGAAPAAEPATPEAAAQVLDLRSFPRMKGAGQNQTNTLAMLMYEAPANPTAAFDFQKTALAKAGWKEQPGGYHAAENHAAQFARDGYSLSVSTSALTGEPDKNGWSRVSLVNHGNVDAKTLPVPKGAKPFGAYGSEAMYLSDGTVADAAESCKKLLTGAGWTAYGSAGGEDAPMLYFKKNAIRVMAWVSTAPAQGNKTMIRYNTELLSADLPLPPDAPDPRYNDSDKSLRFDYPGNSIDPLVDFYTQALSPRGWRATTDKPVTDERKRTAFVIFRNDAGDLISLDMQHFNNIVRTKVEFDTAAEVAEEDRRAKEAAARKLAESKTPPPPAAPTERPAARPKLPQTDDVGALLKAAEKMAADALGEAKSAIESAGSPPAGAPPAGSPPAGAPPATVAPGSDRVADLPLPSSAGVEYKSVTKMIKLTSGDDVAALAAFFQETLPAAGWQIAQRPLVTETSAILKFSRGAATVSVMASQEKNGSSATVMTKGLNWDQVPPGRKATAVAAAPSPRASRSVPVEMPAAEEPAEEEKPQPARMRYAARISEAEQKQTGASIRAGGKEFKLAYGVAFQAVEYDELKTEVLLSTKPIPVEKVVALLNNGQDGGDALRFDPQLKLRFGPDGSLSYVFLYADGLSVNLGGQGEDKIRAKLTIDGGRASGKAELVQPGKLFDNEYTFTAPFDVKLIVGSAAPGGEKPSAAGDEPLAGEDYEGLPIPLITTNRSSIGSPFRKTIEVTVPAPLEAVVKFNRAELARLGWKEDPRAAKEGSQNVSLQFAGSGGTLAVEIVREDDQTVARLATRDPAKAKAAGIAPQEGKGLLILGNAGQREAVVVINGQQYKVAAGKGANNPKDGVLLHVLPGNYKVTIKAPGQDDQDEKLKIAIGETWGVIVLPEGGAFADQVY